MAKAKKTAAEPKPQGLKLLKAKVHDFKRIQLCEIEPNGSEVVFHGRNGAGKSSNIDAVWAAIGGKDPNLAVPVRKGADFAEVELTLGEVNLPSLIVRMKQQADTKDEEGKVIKGKRYLDLLKPDGTKYPQAQTTIDAMLGQLMYDPLRFAKLKPADQAAQLAAVCGIDIKAVSVKRAGLYQLRTEANKKAKEADADWKVKKQRTYDQMIKAGLKELPKAEINVADVMAELKKAQETNKKIDEQSRVCQQIATDCESKRRQIKEIVDYIEEQESLLADAKERLKDQQNRLATLESDYKTGLANEKNAKRLPTEKYEKQIESAQSVNGVVKAAKEQDEAEKKAAEAKKKAAEADKAIETFDQEFDEQLENSPVPLKGVRFNLEGVEVNGIPFEQIAESERIRLSAEIGAASNCQIRIMSIQDASLLDDGNMAIIREIAERRNVQLLLEVVGDQVDGEGMKVHIVDGRAF